MSWFLPIITNAVTRAMKDPSRTSIGSEAGQWPNGWPTITKCGRWNPPGFIPHTSSFERMLEHGAGELRRIGGFLGFHPTDDAIEEILAFLQIDHIRKATWQEHDNISFFRKVLPGIGKTTLQHRSRKTSRSGACIRDRGTGNGGVLHDGSDRLRILGARMRSSTLVADGRPAESQASGSGTANERRWAPALNRRYPPTATASLHRLHDSRPTPCGKFPAAR